MIEILKGKTLLIVEDEVDLREPLVIEFESLGCKVFQASNGKDALPILIKEKIDAVISDIRMPGGDGVELLKNIRNQDHNFPVVMLITGFSDLSKEEAYHLGADAILSKPFDLDEIDTAVVKILTPRETRWQKPFKPENIPHKFEKYFSTLPKAVEEGQIGIGRGGFFIKENAPHPPLDQEVLFYIKFIEGEALVLEGSGIVRWARADDVSSLPVGCGVEFESIKEPGRSEILAITQAFKTKPYIPKNPQLS